MAFFALWMDSNYAFQFDFSIFTTKFYPIEMEKPDNNKNEPKEVEEILTLQIKTGLKEHHRSVRKLFISSFSAGLEVGFSLFFMAILHTLFYQYINQSVMYLILAMAYPIGFIFVVLGRSELFTEHTTLAVFPVLDRLASLRSLFVVWGVVYTGNLLGGYFFGFISTIMAPALKIISVESFEYLALKMTNHQWWVILGSGVLAGWLMGLLSWMVASSQDSISRIFIVIIDRKSVV